MEDTYKVRLEIFEGPLDLLLYLIKRDEIDIYDISLERITSQYLEYIDAFQLLNIGVASEFIVMAANLMYLKSRLLLPQNQQLPEDDAADDDPRWDLIRQLVEYKKFKEAADFLRHREETGEFLMPAYPEPVKEIPDTNALPLETGIFDLIRAFQKVLKRFDSEHQTLEIHEDRFSVADKIEHLLSHLRPGTRVPFTSLFAAAGSRGEIIVTFLAMLELIKLNQLQVDQADPLGEIMVIRPGEA